MKNDTENKSFGYTLGRMLGNVFTGCIFACLSAIMITLTIKFIMWIV